MSKILASSLALALLLVAVAAAPAQVVAHWESPHGHPLDLTPNGQRLVACNTGDHRLEVFDLAPSGPVWTGAVQVGLEPVTARALTSDVVWVVNHVSDTICVVDVATLRVETILYTSDEPVDVVFVGVGSGGTTGEAWVSCSQANEIQVFDLSNLTAPPTVIPIDGEDPRSLVVSPAGDTVYCAVFYSGNDTTILPGGSIIDSPKNIVGAPGTPHGAQNPPPNAGSGFSPPKSPGFAPPVGLVVRKSAAGQWIDDNNGDWTPWVTGASAPAFDRLQGWDMKDHDVAIIDVSTKAVTYASGAMHLCMSLAIRPKPGGHDVMVVGTDATNEIRFEPNLTGTFVRANAALVDPTSATTVAVSDLNPHLSYGMATVPQSQRDLSIGDPRGAVWDAAGSSCWVTGRGSNNVARYDAQLNRTAEIEVGAGPTGAVLDESAGRLYVLAKHEAAISVIDTGTDVELDRVGFPDTTPTEIKRGRKHLYDTHRTSGLGQVACASCHVDGTMDLLAWDLGNPAGQAKIVTAQNMNVILNPILFAGGLIHDAMKGPMTTQTFLGIIGTEPLHWRGDRKSLQEFNPAFEGLLGDDAPLGGREMEEFSEFLATLRIPPNPFRGLDDSLPTSVPLPGLHYSPQGGGHVPLPDGNAQDGLAKFFPPFFPDGFACVTCHTTPTGKGTDHGLDLTTLTYVPMPLGGFGENHTAFHTADPNTQQPFLIPQLRNMHEKTGFTLQELESRLGFGYIHDGSVDTVAKFISEPVFTHTPGNEAQDVADLTAFMFAFGGPGLPTGTTSTLLTPPGPPSVDAHGGVGWQYKIDVGSPLSAADAAVIGQIFTIYSASPGEISIIIKQNQPGAPQRGFAYQGLDLFQPDTAGPAWNLGTLLGTVGPGTEIVITAVVAGTETQLGIDADLDGALDGDELAAGTDPRDPNLVPPAVGACGATAPSPPTGVGATSGSPHDVTVSWTDASADEDGFLVERAWTNSPQWERMGTVGADVTSLVDDSVVPATGYRYRVSAFNCAGYSPRALLPGSVTPTIVPQQLTCHVHAVEAQGFDFGAQGQLAYGVVTVVDDQGRNVEGVLVTAGWTGPTGGGPTALTNEHGQALFITAPTPVPAPSWTLTVAGIGPGPSSPPVAYDPGANFETSKSVTLP